VETVRTEFDPYLHDPLHWGASMVHHADLMLRCFDAVGARSVVEVGAYAGDLTRVLVDWAGQTGARVQAVDPVPQPALVELAEKHDGLELIRETSLEALPKLQLPDALIIDGDHNYYTVSEELRLVGERASGTELPLLLFHDVCWPHGRRDDYYAPEQVPADYRHPIVGDGAGIFPGDPGVRPDGLPYVKSAAHEGGPRNGVLTAVEDFVAGRDQLRLVVVPAFFGFGAVWHLDAPWSEGVAQVLDPFDQNPMLARLEANRIEHIAQEQGLQAKLWKADERQQRYRALLTRMLESRAFLIAERLSALRMRAGIAPGSAEVSREQIRRVMAD